MIDLESFVRDVLLEITKGIKAAAQGQQGEAGGTASTSTVASRVKFSVPVLLPSVPWEGGQ
jgi:hypothetical protein